jgi:hypothetical protein
MRKTHSRGRVERHVRRPSEDSRQTISRSPAYPYRNRLGSKSSGHSLGLSFGSRNHASFHLAPIRKSPWGHRSSDRQSENSSFLRSHRKCRRPRGSELQVPAVWLQPPLGDGIRSLCFVSVCFEDGANAAHGISTSLSGRQKNADSFCRTVLDAHVSS